MIVGVTRLRNEEPIIGATLDHVAGLVDEIVVYDDCSTDATADICEEHSAVVKVIRGTVWDSDPQHRAIAEGVLRQIPFMEACNRGAEWVYYFDGDEFLEPDYRSDSPALLEDDPCGHLIDTGRAVPSTGGLRYLIKQRPDCNAFRFRLFDYYITAEDKGLDYRQRRWIGPEYRDILMLFRVTPGVVFHNREPSGAPMPISMAGWVKHYGKAISVEHWEETCEYYVNHRGGGLLPEFTVKWAGRRGKAVHQKSDFGAPLILWEDRIKKGYPLVDRPEDWRQKSSEQAG